MPETKSPPAKITPKRGWWRRLFRGALWTLLVLVVLHRPLIHYGVPFVAALLAKRQHLDVSLELSGSIFTNLAATNVRVTPSGTGPTPVERIKIDALRLDYSLWKLAREGVGEFISSYELHHADLAFVALPSRTTEEKKAKKSLAETLRKVLAQPAAYSDRVKIEDFNLTVRSPEAETHLHGLDLLLDPQKQGHLRIARLAVPGLPAWENLRAETTYVNRNLYQRGLRLGPEIEIEELNFDASRRLEGEGSIALKARVFGGSVALSLSGEKTGAAGEHLEKQYATRLKVAMSGVRVRDAAAYFGAKNVPLERLTAFDLDFTGDPEKPRTWKGTARVQVEKIAAGALTIPQAQSVADFNRGVANLKTNVQIEGNAAQAEAKADLPEDVADFLSAGIDAKIELLARDLPAVITPFVAEAKTSGTLLGSGTLGLRERRATAQLEFSGKDIVFNEAGVALAGLRIEASKALDEKKPLGGLEANVTLDAQQLRAGTFGIDAAKIGATLSKGAVAVRELAVTRGTNRIGGTGRVFLPTEKEPIAGEAQLSVQAPKLAEFGIAAGGQTLDGKLETTAQVKFAGERIDGDVQLGGGTFTLGEFQTGALAGRVAMRGSEVQVESLTLALNDHDRLTVQGRYFTTERGRYDGTLTFGIKDLAVLDPLLRVFGVKEPLRGALDIAWKGNGTVQAKQHRGEASVTLLGAEYGKQKLNELRLGGRYTETTAQAELRAAAGPTKLATQIVWAEKQLGLRDLELRQGEQRALTGELGISLAAPDGTKLDPLQQPLKISLHADQLDLEKLLTSLGQTAPAGGKLTLHLAASGTAARPEVELRIEGRALKAKAAAQFDPADLDVALDYQPGALSLKAGVRQPLLQPLEITASAPLDVEKVIADKKLDPAMTFAAAVKLPPTSLAFLPKVAPQVRRIDGTASIDVKATGTVDKPVLDGALIVALKNARLASEGAPSIGQFDAQLAFDADTVKFTKVHGEVGGGTFDLFGKIELAQLDNPVFDLVLKADEVLVKRDDAITVRADADVKVAGPLKAGSLTGEVALTQSRFFKEIDILPIGLPGRPKPAPKSAPSDPDIALPPPLDKWKIDLAIKTRDDDPFLIRGNLANGQVAMNLRVGNTGATPWVEGAVTIDQFKASLPFSTLTLDNGKVFFTKNAPLTQPTLDLQAQSKVRDYTVNAFIFGKATEPQIQFTSEPPLPHADIVSLLATGTTTSEITGNADVLASRAAMLAVQSLWKKMFSKGKAAPAPAAKKSGDPGFMDRFELELGAVDNKTGAREATAKYKVNDQIYILGELDTQGRYTGSLKYLLRFR